MPLISTNQKHTIHHQQQQQHLDMEQQQQQQHHDSSSPSSISTRHRKHYSTPNSSDNAKQTYPTHAQQQQQQQQPPQRLLLSSFNRIGNNSNTMSRKVFIKRLIIFSIVAIMFIIVPDPFDDDNENNNGNNNNNNFQQQQQKQQRQPPIRIGATRKPAISYFDIVKASTSSGDDYSSSYTDLPPSSYSISIPDNREDRFPSIEERVKLYMSNWYLPPCKSSISQTTTTTTKKEPKKRKKNIITPPPITNSIDSALVKYRYTINKRNDISPWLQTIRIGINNKRSSEKGNKLYVGINTKKNRTLDTLTIRNVIEPDTIFMYDDDIVDECLQCKNRNNTNEDITIHLKKRVQQVDQNSINNNTETTTTTEETDDERQTQEVDIDNNDENSTSSTTTSSSNNKELNKSVEYCRNMLTYCIDVSRLIRPIVKNDIELQFPPIAASSEQDSVKEQDGSKQATTVITRSRYDNTIPILLQFGDMSHSHKFGNVNIPYIKKFRSGFYPTIQSLIDVTTVTGQQQEEGQEQCYDDLATTGGSNYNRPMLRNQHNTHQYYSPIIWKLEIQRHYGTLHTIKNLDSLPWEEKKNMAIFRGQLTGAFFNMNTNTSDYDNCLSMNRCKFVLDNYNSSIIDAKLTSTRNYLPDTIIKREEEKDDDVPYNIVVKKIQKDVLMSYKAIIMIEGNDVSSGLKWSLLSSSVVMMPKPKYTSWTMEELLIPWVHYVPLKDDMSDVAEKMTWILDNEHLAQRISKRATLWIEDLILSDDAKNDDIIIQNEIIHRYKKHFIHDMEF